MMKIGEEAEGKWKGIRTLFIETTNCSDWMVTPMVRSIKNALEDNECPHVYFGVHGTYFEHSPLVWERSRSVVDAFAGCYPVLTTIEVDFYRSSHLIPLELLERPQTRFLLTIGKRTCLDPTRVLDASIRLLQHHNVELKIDGSMTAAVLSNPSILDLTYCRDEEI